MTLASLDLLGGVKAARAAGIGNLDALRVNDGGAGAGLAGDTLAVGPDQIWFRFFQVPSSRKRMNQRDAV